MKTNCPSRAVVEETVLQEIVSIGLSARRIMSRTTCPKVRDLAQKILDRVHTIAEWVDLRGTKAEDLHKSYQDCSSRDGQLRRVYPD